MQTLDRRDFIKSSTWAGLAGTAAVATTLGAGSAYPSSTENKISLATWSLVRSFQSGVCKLTDIHRICRQDLGLDGVEYVTSFFESPVAGYLDRLNRNSQEFGVSNVLIMVDNEGPMLAQEKPARLQAAINHRKWIEIAAYLGCHAIRCNAHGGGKTSAEDPSAIDRGAESFGALLEYAKEFQINVIIENHGGLSSEPDFLPALARKLNSPHFGILPDYGNYTRGSDIADAVRKAMPFAKGVSVKASWQPDGSHPEWDLEQLLGISKAAGYKGYWGIESGLRRPPAERVTDPEAIKKDEWQAVLWTKAVIQEVVFV